MRNFGILDVIAIVLEVLLNEITTVVAIIIFVTALVLLITLRKNFLHRKKG